MKSMIQNFRNQVESLSITNDTELENANLLAKKCNNMIKEIKKLHQDDIAKYYKLHKESKAKEREELEPLENGKVILKKAIGAYMKELEKKRLEIEKNQREEEEIFGEIITEKQKINLSGTHVRKKWKARVVDEKDVPVYFKKLIIRKIDISVLNDLAARYDGKLEISGIEFYQEDTVVLR